MNLIHQTGQARRGLVLDGGLGCTSHEPLAPLGQAHRGPSCRRPAPSRLARLERTVHRLDRRSAKPRLPDAFTHRRPAPSRLARLERTVRKLDRRSAKPRLPDGLAPSEAKGSPATCEQHSYCRLQSSPRSNLVSKAPPRQASDTIHSYNQSQSPPVTQSLCHEDTSEIARSDTLRENLKGIFCERNR